MPVRSVPLDALRGLAVIFMLEVHLGFWWASDLPEGNALVGLGTAMGGMAAPLFFTIAGAGLSLSRTREPDGFQARNLRRGAALLAGGLVFTYIEMAVYGPWGWGVLQSLGVSIIICALAMRAGPAVRAMAAIAFMAAAPLARAAAGIPDVVYSEEMMGVSSPPEYLQSALLSGFFPLIPWTGFMLLGTAAQELLLAYSHPASKGAILSKRTIWPAALLAGFLMLAGAAGAAGGLPMEFFPPSLPFCLLASGLCIAALAAGRAIIWKPAPAGRAAPLASTGRLSLTFFIAHHFIGYDAFSAAGLLHSFDIAWALAMVIFSWALATAIAVAWSRKGFICSLEWLIGLFGSQTSK